MRLSSLADSLWRSYFSWALWPFSLVFRGIVYLRRRMFIWGWRKSYDCPVSVVVVGGITVGGSGKTPLILHLAHTLRRAGFNPGIVSRGYSGTRKTPLEIKSETPPNIAGDEPVMLASRSRCPVFIGRKRPQAIQALLATHPKVNVILADDGLQHYAMKRDIEIVVVEEQGFGRGLVLPAGSLREPPSRLQEVDFLVLHGRAFVQPIGPKIFTMKLVGDHFHHLQDHHLSRSAEELQDRPLIAMAGIGNPERFFQHLETLGLTIHRLPLPDHHAYSRSEIEKLSNKRVIVTAKDAVKCRLLAPRNCDIWVLEVEAILTPSLTSAVLEKIKH